MSELYKLPDGWEWKKFTETIEFSNKTININKVEYCKTVFSCGGV